MYLHRCKRKEPSHNEGGNDDEVKEETDDEGDYCDTSCINDGNSGAG